MSFTKMTDDLNIIQGLPDLPNDVGGLTAAQLKATYDKAGLLLKKYINEVLIPEIEGNGGAASVGISEIEGVNATTVQRALEILRGQLMETTVGVIPDGSITTAKYANESVTGEKLANGAVSTSKISDGAITNDKIESVKSDKIDGDVSNIADDVIATNKIKNFAVTQNKLANAAVTEEKISAGAVTGVKIANAAVSRSKLAQDALYSPFKGFDSSGASTISNNDIGKTIRTVNSNVDYTINIERDTSIPAGAEVAVFRQWAKTINIVFGDNIRVAIPGETSYMTSPTFTIEPFTMIALKKLLSDSTNDYWLVTGSVEVV